MMSQPKILITGAKGQVGWELQRTMSTLGKIIAIDREELDLTDANGIRSFVREVRPDLVINAAAYTAVDQAEKEPELANLLNAEAPRVLAEEAKKSGAPFISYSTDYVFDGTATEPYTETSRPNPLSAYGRSKLAGDEAVQSVGGACLIFRTSWVYGARGKNFLLTMLRLASERSELRVVNDQVGAPTWSRSIAEATAQIIAIGCAGKNRKDLFDYLSARSGVYNMVSSGCTSWFGFAEAIIQPALREKTIKLIAIASAEYATPAARPKSSLLSIEKLQATFGICMPDWRDALTQVLETVATGRQRWD